MADTIGDMIDKLTIANIRVWMLEDWRREYSTGNSSMSEVEVKDKLIKVSQTNRERNDLIDQINGSIRVLVDKANQQDSTFQIDAERLLGTGKNKFYSKEDK